MERKIDKRLKGKFEMVKLMPGAVVFRNKKYDTRSMSVKEADQAIKEGATFIKRLKKESQNEN